MNFLKRILNKIKTKPTIKVGYKEVTVIGMIYATVVFHYDWNDPVEILNNATETALILDVVSAENEIDSKMSYWNKMYYNNLTAHYQLNESRLESISEILNVPKEKHTDLYHNWPAVISEEQYKQMYKTLNLKFVQYKPLNEKYVGKYVIKLNESFWDIKTYTYNGKTYSYNGRLLVDIINTYERNFNDFELIHDTYEQAMYYGIIIMDKLLIAPDYPRFYEQRIQEQLPQFPKLLIFNHHISSDQEKVKAEYNRIIREMKSDLELMKKTFETINNKPFEVIKIKGVD